LSSILNEDTIQYNSEATDSFLLSPDLAGLGQASSIQSSICSQPQKAHSWPRGTRDEN